MISDPEMKIIHRRHWRADIWDEDMPSREGWQVQCSEHGLLGNPQGWAYETPGRAKSVAGHHLRKHERAAARA